jgi:hypothetical protein
VKWEVPAPFEAVQVEYNYGRRWTLKTPDGNIYGEAASREEADFRVAALNAAYERGFREGIAVIRNEQGKRGRLFVENGCIIEEHWEEGTD